MLAVLTTTDIVIDDDSIGDQHCVISRSFSEDAADRPSITFCSLKSTDLSTGSLKQIHAKRLIDGTRIELGSCEFVFKVPQRSHRRDFLDYFTMAQNDRNFSDRTFSCANKFSGETYIVSRYPTPSREDQAQSDYLKEYVASLMVLNMSVPNLRCLEDTFESGDFVYLVFKKARLKHSLFQVIAERKKLTELQARFILKQLLRSVRNMVCVIVEQRARILY